MDPFVLQREKQAEIIFNRLQDNILTFEVLSFRLEEILHSERTVVSSDCILFNKNYSHSFNFAYEADGFVDAFTSGVIKTLAPEFPSLNTFSFHAFEVTALIDNKNQTNAVVKTELVISNSYGKKLLFESSSRSLIAASLKTVKTAIEHLTNSERTVTLLKECIKDSESRNRMDLKSKYISELAELVRVTNYESIV